MTRYAQRRQNESIDRQQERFNEGTVQNLPGYIEDVCRGNVA
jgi:hypothetical protein